MMPIITNNRTQALAISVRFSLIPLIAALLFVGMLATAADTSPSVHATGNKNPTASPHAPTNKVTDNNFFASLRFWEKNKATGHSQQPRAPRPAQVSSAGTRNISGGQPDSPTAQRSAAPEPPPIPQMEPRTGLGSAPLPEWSENFVYNTDGGSVHATQEIGQPNRASHVSYSFDTRDWVESFPHQQEARKGTLTTMQATSLRSSPRAAEPLSPQPQAGDDTQSKGDESKFWDGQATKLATIASIRNEINLMQQDHVVEPSASSLPYAAAPDKGTQQIDLSPSYQSRLQYVQTCGVVVVQANFPLTEIASILDEINMLQHDLTRYIGVPAPQEKIELCLFQDQTSYQNFLKEFFPKAPDNRRALFVKLDNKPGTLMVQQSKDFEVDLRHEMTHAIVHASMLRMPIWLDEGLAKYFEVPPQDRANSHPYMENARFNARLGMVPSLDRLTKLETIDDMATKEYRESWAWTHFLIHRSPGTHRLLAGYLQMLANFSPEEVKTGSTVSQGLIPVNWSGARRESIPSLKLYLDDVMPNQREAFREHFGVFER